MTGKTAPFDGETIKAAVERRALTTEEAEAKGQEEQAAALSARRARAFTPLASAYGWEHLERDQAQTVVSVDAVGGRWLQGRAGDLADRDRRHTKGHGWGPVLNNVVTGLRPGTFLAVAASAAKSGKTAFVHQLSDGLALRTAELLRPGADPKATLTPVVFLSEMDPRSLQYRTVGRWLGVTASQFRWGASPGGHTEDVWHQAKEALSQGPLAESQRHIDVRGTMTSGDDFIELLKWKAAALRADPRYAGREVWPVFVLDPVQRYAEVADTTGRMSEVDVFYDRLGNLTKDEGLIVLCTSDSTKAAATTRDDDQTPEQRGAAAFRGTYRLQHIWEAGLFVDTVDAPELPAPWRRVTVTPIAPRWGSGGAAAAFDFHPPTMRLYALEGTAITEEKKHKKEAPKEFMKLVRKTMGEEIRQSSIGNPDRVVTVTMRRLRGQAEEEGVTHEQLWGLVEAEAKNQGLAVADIPWREEKKPGPRQTEASLSTEEEKE